MRFLSLLLFVPLAALAQDKKPEVKKPEKIAINDPAKLKDDKDFAMQGEFSAELERAGRKFKGGAQLIARGGGKFELRTYRGGLPGDGWSQEKDETLIYGLGQLNGDKVEGKIKVGEIVTFAKVGKDGVVAANESKDVIEAYTATATGITIGVGMNELTAKRVERTSPTLGAKPPEGAIVLYNSPEDLDKWTGMKVVELSDGKFLGVGGRTKQKFQSFNLHLEFRLPFMPASTGQGRGNSGVYLQDRYELQVLDSFGLKGVDNECGGIYKESAPKVNMCFPPMVWQTYDIDFTAANFADGKKTSPATVTVKHNGVVIHDKLQLKSNTPGGGINKEVPEPGALHLQNHGDPVVYRNVWIKER